MEMTIDLGARSYPIMIDENISHRLPTFLKTTFQQTKFGLVTNETLFAAYKSHIDLWSKELNLLVHVVPDGERYKTFETWTKIFDTFLAAKFERKSALIAFGGGVVGDMTGFAAATMLRGIPYVQVPTTLLAMIDSSVGGKTGINHPAGKNLIGTFHQPGMVWIDTAYLKTLPPREFMAGYAELFKYAFIGGRRMFDFIAGNHDFLVRGDRTILTEAIRRCIKIKADIVEQDEFETKGLRMFLNFGHTFAHALEKYFGYENILHGEAVWWGMICACQLGKFIGSTPAPTMPAYDEMIAKMHKPALPSLPPPEALYEAMLFDKKVKDGKIRFVVPAERGISIVKPQVDKDKVMRVLEVVFGG